MSLAIMYTPGDYAEFRGDVQMIQRMRRQEALAKMTPEQRAELKKREAKYAAEAARRKSFIAAFKQGGARIYLLPSGAPTGGGRRGGGGPRRKAKKIKTDQERVPTHLVDTYNMLQTLALDDANPNQWVNFFSALPNREIYKIPLGKFRFTYDENGRMVYVPWTEQTWINFFRNPQRGRWIPNVPFSYKCDTNWETKWIKEYTKISRKWAAKYRSTSDYRHVWQHIAGASKCKKKKKSLWMKIRKVVVGAVAVVAAVYLGPIVFDKVGAYLAGASGGTAGGGAGAGVATATKTATFISKVKNGITIYNKVNTVAHIVQGKIPPPPIGITGGTFRTVAFNLVKQKIKDEAIDLAMEQGIKYIEKKMTEKEERAIKAEIAELQRQMDALVPKDTPIMPSPELPEADRKAIAEIQVIQAKREQQNQVTIMAVLAGGALMLAG